MSEPQVNRRQSKRKRFSQHALAKVASGQTILCTVTDISRSGARLRATFGELPQSFRLVFSDDGRISRECYVVWQRGLDFGIRFKERCSIRLPE